MESPMFKYNYPNADNGDIELKGASLMQELVKMGYLTGEQYRKAMVYQQQKRCKIGIALMELGMINDKIMEQFAKRMLGK